MERHVDEAIVHVVGEYPKGIYSAVGYCELPDDGIYVVKRFRYSENWCIAYKAAAIHLENVALSAQGCHRVAKRELAAAANPAG